MGPSVVVAGARGRGEPLAISSRSHVLAAAAGVAALRRARGQAPAAVVVLQVPPAAARPKVLPGTGEGPHDALRVLAVVPLCDLVVVVHAEVVS